MLRRRWRHYTFLGATCTAALGVTVHSQVALRDVLGLLLRQGSDTPVRTPKGMVGRQKQDSSQGRQLLEVPINGAEVVSPSSHAMADDGRDGGESFRPDNIVVQNLVPCGNSKCFYPIKSNPEVGYLVWDAEYLRRSVSTVMKKCEATLSFARSLEERYGPINHHLLGNPISLKVSSELASMMNENCPYTGSRFKPEHGNKTRYHPGHEVVIQQSQRIVGSTIILKVYRGDKFAEFRERLREFLSSVADPTPFARRFNKNMVRTRQLLREEICLGQDFQVLVDSEGEFVSLMKKKSHNHDFSGRSLLFPNPSTLALPLFMFVYYIYSSSALVPHRFGPVYRKGWVWQAQENGCQVEG